MQYKFDEVNHLHSLDGKPLIGTSTVVNVLSKPLTWWAAGLAVEKLGWLKKVDPRKSTKEEIERNKQQRELKAEYALENIAKLHTDGEPEKYLALLDAAYRAHADSLNKSADKGTDMHAELEAYVKDCITHRGAPLTQILAGHEPVRIFAAWAYQNVKRFIVSEGHTYSERLWTGGITDCIAELKDGRMIIIDFKSSKEAYFSQFVQVAGYDIEASENGIFDADGNLLLKLDKPIDGYVVFPFGAEKVEPQFQFDTIGVRKGFEACVTLHKLINNN
jgi:hypothetical protein